MSDELQMPGSVDDLVLVSRGLLGAAAYIARQHRDASSMTLKRLREAAMKPAYSAADDDALVERLALWGLNLARTGLPLFSALGDVGPQNKEIWLDRVRIVMCPPGSPRKTRRQIAEEIFNVEIKGEGYHFNEDAKLATIKAIEAALELPATED